MAKVINGNLNQVNTVSRPKAFDKRIHEIDFVRGLLMCLVLLDHILNNIMIYFKGWGPGFREVGLFIQDFYWNGALRSIIQPLCLMAFCLVSGISTAFSRNNWKRSGLMIIVWVAVMIVTSVFGPVFGFYPIYFNIIGVLAWSSLIYCFFQERSWKSSLGIALISMLVTLCVLNPILSDLFYNAWNPFEINYSSPYAEMFVPFIFKPMMFKQGDYMSLFPYMMFFFIGVIMTNFIYKDKKSHVKRRFEWERPFCFIGRHSLIIYLAHQVVLLPIFMILNIFLKV